MTFRIWPTRSAKTPSAEPAVPAPKLRIGIPRTLNQWSTHRFWVALFTGLGVNPRDVVFSSHTSEAQQRDYGRGRGAVDCCFPVKCMTGHYGELLEGMKRPINVLFSPKLASVPSILQGHVLDNLTCPRVSAAPESARAGFVRESDAFAAKGVTYLAPVVNLAEPRLAARQLHAALERLFPGLQPARTEAAVTLGYAALADWDDRMRAKSREILEACARDERPAILALGRPYHMDTGIGHEIESELQTYGYPVLWGQYLPTDADLLERCFGADIRAGRIKSAFGISDVWKSSYSANTNELIWAARYGARLPEIACTIRFSSYECGMDQPTYTPVQALTEETGTLFFAFQDLDSTKPGGAVKIRVETIAYYLGQLAAEIMAKKRARLSELRESVIQ